MGIKQWDTFGDYKTFYKFQDFPQFDPSHRTDYIINMELKRQMLLGLKSFQISHGFYRMDFKQLLANIWVLAYCLQGRGSLKCIKADCKHFQTPIYLDSNPLWAYMIKQIFWQKSTFCTLALTPGMFWNIQRHHWDLIWKFWLYCWSIREVLNQ